MQAAYARISGYCEQTDIHSPQITVEESVVYSAWLRLPPQIDQHTRAVRSLGAGPNHSILFVYGYVI